MLCVGVAFLLLACQVVGYRPESSAEETAPGKVDTVKVAASGGAGPPSSSKGAARLPRQPIMQGSSCRQRSRARCPAQTARASATTLISGRMGSFTCVRPISEPLWSRTTEALAQGFKPGGHFAFTAAVKGRVSSRSRPHTDRLLDQQGRPIQSSLPYELISDGTLTRPISA